jgi:muramoyltetrapeptide carboxypeptidase
MRRPPPLIAEAARVRLVAPAGPFPRELLDAGIAQLREWGLEVSVGEHALDRHPALPYLAGTDADRAADLHEAWCDPDVDAVLCLRGGYGCLRLLDRLDWDKLAAATPKIFAGSSDVTALHEAFAARLGVATLFSPMIATKAFTTDTTTREGLRRCLFGPAPIPLTGGQALSGGVARGMAVGGNLSLLVAMLGAGPPPPPGSVLLLEDVAEAPYRVDRMLTQLRRAGWFDAVAGVALGSWTDCGDLRVLDAVLADRLGELGVPVVAGLTFGHCQAQASIPLGVPCELDADAGTLTPGTFTQR